MNANSANVRAAARLVLASQKAYSRKWSFLAVFAFVLSLSVATAGALDILPDPQGPSRAAAVADAQTPAAAPIVASSPEQPTKIEIPAIGLSQKVSNPTSTDVEKLDAALLTGPVRYPSSSNLGEEGTVIIFGHSSYLPIVNNKAFKAFNGIQKLKAGDRIEVTGESHVFVYAVQTVETEDATADAIPLAAQGSTLTLATCDSFGEKTDRFVVTATLVETDPL